MKVKTKLLLLCSLGLICFAGPAWADYPVIDYTEIQRTMQMIEQIKENYSVLQSQYNQLKQQYSAVTGNYGWGTFHNTVTNLQKDRQWAAEDWRSALQGVSGGNPQRYQQLLSQYKQSNPAMAQQKYQKGADQNRSLDYQNQVQTNQASATQAEYEYGDINKHMKNLYDLSQKLEDAKQNNDMKSAVDLNSRILIEIGYIQTEEVRMETLINSQLAQMQSSQIIKENQESQFNQAGGQP